jgi:hypothetical protein
MFWPLAIIRNARSLLATLLSLHWPVFTEGMYGGVLLTCIYVFVKTINIEIAKTPRETVVCDAVLTTRGI